MNESRRLIRSAFVALNTLEAALLDIEVAAGNEDPWPTIYHYTEPIMRELLRIARGSVA